MKKIEFQNVPTPKFALGQVVWALRNLKIRKLLITGITCKGKIHNCTYDDKTLDIHKLKLKDVSWETCYDVVYSEEDGIFSLPEERLFPTKEEAVLSLD